MLDSIILNFFKFLGIILNFFKFPRVKSFIAIVCTLFYSKYELKLLMKGDILYG